MVRIKTERLGLREISSNDFDAIHEYASDPEVVEYVNWGPNTLKDTGDFIARQIANQSKKKRDEIVLAVCADNVMTGTVGITIKGDEAEFGYAFNRNYWGRGYATEAAKVLIKYVLDTFLLKKIKATCDVKNVASRNVIEKCGLSLVKRVDDEVEVRGKMRDTYFFEMEV